MPSVIVKFVPRSDIGYLEGQTCGDGTQDIPGPLDYESQAGEAPGRWVNGEDTLGLARGLVASDDITTIYRHLKHPKTGDQLGQKPATYRTQQERIDAAIALEPNALPERHRQIRFDILSQPTPQARNYWDMCVSPDKTWSVLEAAYRAAGDHESAEKLWVALEAGALAGLRLAQDHHLCRKGHHGRKIGGYTSGQYIETEAIPTVLFRHRTSRDGDPQMHLHLALLNRVKCADGVWRSLDGDVFQEMREGIQAFVARVAEEQARVTLGLDFVMRPDMSARAIVGVDDEICKMFSKRRRTIAPEIAAMANAHRDKYGEDPSPWLLSDMAQHATLRTRRKKGPPKSPEELLATWESESRSRFGYGLTKVLRSVVLREPEDIAFDPNGVAQLAIAEVQRNHPTWNRWHLARAIQNHLPDCLGGLTEEQIRNLTERMVGDALLDESIVTIRPPKLFNVPTELQRPDGRSIYERHDSGRYTTKDHLSAEDRIIGHARGKGAASMAPSKAVEVLASSQANEKQLKTLLGILTSGRKVELIRAPAGTGKSFIAGELAAFWPTIAKQSVFGLTVAQNAVEVLREEGLDEGANISRFLDLQAQLNDPSACRQYDRDQLAKALKAMRSSAKYQHADNIQRQILTAGVRQKADRQAEGRKQERETCRIQRGQLVYLDEASMIPTADLIRAMDYCIAAGAKIVVCGDDRQLASVGAGGAFSLLVNELYSYELDEVRRFDQQWERDASLLLRDGDVTGIDEYDRRGRLVGGTAEEMEVAAVTAFIADTINGKRSLLLANSENQASELALKVREQLVFAGKIVAEGVSLRDGNTAGIGDLIQTRRNDRRVRDSNGRWVVNRDVYRVVGIDGGGLKVERHLENGGWGEAICLPHAYVASHTVLAYATTVHAAQGRTVDTCHSLITDTTNAASLYVSMTRGKVANFAYVACHAEGDGEQDPRNDHHLAMLRASLATKRGQQTSARIAEREEFDASESLGRLGPIWSDLIAQLNAERYEQLLSALLSENERERLLNDEAVGALWRLVRAAERANYNINALLTSCVRRREFDTAESIAQVLHWRVTQAIGEIVSLRDDVSPGFISQTPQIEGPIGQYLVDLAEAMDRRVMALGEKTRIERPEWSWTFGDEPKDPMERCHWIQRLAAVAAYRDQFGYEAVRDPIGPMPSRGNVDAWFAWHRANRAIGRTDSVDIVGASDVKLHGLITHYEREKAWAPDCVDDQMQSTHHGIRRTQTRLAELKLEYGRSRNDETSRQVREQTALLNRMHERAEQLETIAYARNQWIAETEGARQLANAAITEIIRRNNSYEASSPHLAPEPELSESAWRAAREVFEAQMRRAQCALETIRLRREEEASDDEERIKRLHGDTHRPAASVLYGPAAIRYHNHGLQR